MILDSGKTQPRRCDRLRMFESVVILDSGKTRRPYYYYLGPAFESVVILDSGKTVAHAFGVSMEFESVVILDRFSKRGQNLWRLLPPFFCIPREAWIEIGRRRRGLWLLPVASPAGSVD